MASKRACFSFLYYISHDDVDNWANIVHGCRQGSMCFVHYHHNNQWCEVCTSHMQNISSDAKGPRAQHLFIRVRRLPGFRRGRPRRSQASPATRQHVTRQKGKKKGRIAGQWTPTPTSS